MASISVVYLLRHGESEHNVSGDFSQPDPPLTAVGVTQAAALTGTFPAPDAIGAILTSPLTRTLQTTLGGFSTIINNNNNQDGNGARLIIDKDLQERSNFPCDTGSPASQLAKAFPTLDFGGLDEDWFVKEGLYAPADDVVAKRAQIVRQKILDLVESLALGESRNVVVVTHGTFMKFLARDDAINLPKAGWKAFSVGKDEDGNAILVPAPAE
jgi:broad specificity phosphatase PhoE